MSRGKELAKHAEMAVVYGFAALTGAILADAGIIDNEPAWSWASLLSMIALFVPLCAREVRKYIELRHGSGEP